MSYGVAVQVSGLRSQVSGLRSLASGLRSQSEVQCELRCVRSQLVKNSISPCFSVFLCVNVSRYILHIHIEIDSDRLTRSLKNPRRIVPKLLMSWGISSEGRTPSPTHTSFVPSLDSNSLMSPAPIDLARSMAEAEECSAGDW